MDDVLVVRVEMAVLAELDQLLEVAREREVALRGVLRTLHRAREVVELGQVAPDVLRVGEDEPDLELEDPLELLGEAPYERLTRRDGERQPIDGDGQDAVAFRVRVGHRRRDGAEVDLQRIDVHVRYVELAGQPLDQPIERHLLVRRQQRLPLLIGDRFERMIEAHRARARKLLGRGSADQAVGDHQFEDVLDPQAPIGRRRGTR